MILLDKDDDVVGLLPQKSIEKIEKIKIALLKLINRTELDFALKNKKAESIKHFCLGGNKFSGEIAKTTLDSILYLCRKIDPSIMKV